ncbi:mechanosensitive ion channel family protein [Nanoarchaeota archaeon]
MLIVSFAFAQLVYYFLKTTIEGLVKKTKTPLDDIFVHIVTTPIYYAIIFWGIYYALKSLTIISRYNGLVDKLFFVIAVALVAIVFARITDAFVNKWLRVRNKRTPRLVNKIMNSLIYLVAILMILQFFEVAITPLLATLGLGALALGLALQPTLANLFAGVRILSDKPVQVGDYIEIGDLKGYVEDIGLHTTRIRTLPNNVVVVPNSKLADSIIVNNSLPSEDLGVIVKCGVSYKSNLKKVEKVTLEVAKKIQKTFPGAVKEFKPFMRFEEFGASNINFFVILRAIDYPNKYLVTHEFIKELKSAYDKNKIEISWPIRKIYKGK